VPQPYRSASAIASRHRRRVVANESIFGRSVTEHAGYVSHLLGPQLVTSFGLGLVFVPLALVALHKVAEQDSGVASSLLNTAQQVGGAIGLALLGTVAWTAVADSVRTQVAHAAAAAAKAGRPLPKPGTPPPPSIYDHALTVGFSRAFVVAAGIALLALLIAIVTIRVRRQELTGVAPERQQAPPQPVAPQPGTVQQNEDRAALAAAARPFRLCEPTRHHRPGEEQERLRRPGRERHGQLRCVRRKWRRPGVRSCAGEACYSGHRPGRRFGATC
jgi:uncharacterized membrane protein